ncbi:MAG: Rossmann-like and DUF2520 domain-containing protein [Raoultibacter sp.]
MRIGFVGAGKVGFSLSRYMSEQGISVEGFFSRSAASAQAAADLTGSKAFSSLEEIVAACDCLFITVPDDALADTWEEIRAFPLKEKIVCHCSGLVASSVFADAEALGAYAYSLHPIMAVPHKEAMDSIAAAYFTIEGSLGAMDAIRSLFDQMGNPYEVIESDKKPLYHAACVSVSNLLNGLAKMGEDLFSQCGLDAAFSQEAWRSLFLLQAKNIAAMGVVDSLTGPVERRDVQTVSIHLSHLQNPEREIYRLLSNKVLDIAREKNPTRDYSLLEKELQQ